MKYHFREVLLQIRLQCATTSVIGYFTIYQKWYYLYVSTVERVPKHGRHTIFTSRKSCKTSLGHLYLRAHCPRIAPHRSPSPADRTEPASPSSLAGLRLPYLSQSARPSQRPPEAVRYPVLRMLHVRSNSPAAIVSSPVSRSVSPVARLPVAAPDATVTSRRHLRHHFVRHAQLKSSQSRAETRRYVVEMQRCKCKVGMRPRRLRMKGRPEARPALLRRAGVDSRCSILSGRLRTDQS